MKPFDYNFHIGKTIVVLHHLDQDGHAAAAIAHMALPDLVVHKIPVQYGQPLPEFQKNKDTVVYIVDFSYPREILEKLNNEVARLIVLDHHEGVKSLIGDLEYVQIEHNRAGAGSALDYFFPGLSWDHPHFQKCFAVPMTVDYELTMQRLVAHVQNVAQLVDDYDLWNRENVTAFCFFESVASHLGKSDFQAQHDFWLKLLCEPGEFLNDTFSKMYYLLKTGTPIYQYNMMLATDFAKSGSFREISIQLDDSKAWLGALYNTTENRNFMAEQVLAHHPHIDFTMSYRITHHNRAHVSIRTTGKKGSVKAYEIAAKFGGNGHAEAAAFTMDIENLAKLLKST